MLRLGAGIPNLQNDILTLRDKSIDPSKENEYQKIIKEWEEMDEIIQKHIDEINSKLEKTREDIERVKQDLENANQKSTEVCNTVAIHEKKIETIENKRIEETTRIDQLDDESLEQRTQLSVMESRQQKLEQDMKDTSITCAFLKSFFLIFIIHEKSLFNITLLWSLYISLMRWLKVNRYHNS
jgi:chromosome segregation ATPase